MRVGVVLVGFASFLASMYAVVWLLRDSATLNQSVASSHTAESKPGEKSPAAEPHDHADQKPEGSEPEKPKAERPKVNRDKTAPQPKAVIDEVKLEFGRMEVGEERAHTFVIRNEGNAPLAVVTGPTTCQCTVSAVSRNQVEPGESAEIELKWKPLVETEFFNKGADIWTNDPNHETIKLSIVGMVASRLAVYPGNTWSLLEFREDGRPTEMNGMIVSPILEEFAVTGIVSENPHVTGEATKITDPERLKVVNALSGYDVKVRLAPEITVGGFSIPISIKTDLVSQSGAPIDMAVTIRGSRRGPMRIVGAEWISDLGAITLGTFDASVGKSVTLKVIALNPPPDGLKVNEADIVCDPKELRVRLTPDDKAKGAAGRFLLTVEYPPGSPRATRRDEEAGLVKIRTNHPKASEMEFMVYFSAH